ncbi:MAG: hypothetical protein MPL62_14835, partial [Alphaproteobacteria bacterium]|nr:hypothetical protein [Alphaproteobacteria bacterium]
TRCSGQILSKVPTLLFKLANLPSILSFGNSCVFDYLGLNTKEQIIVCFSNFNANSVCFPSAKVDRDAMNLS